MSKAVYDRFGTVCLFCRSTLSARALGSVVALISDGDGNAAGRRSVGMTICSCALRLLQSL